MDAEVLAGERSTRLQSESFFLVVEVNLLIHLRVVACPVGGFQLFRWEHMEMPFMVMQADVAVWCLEFSRFVVDGAETTPLRQSHNRWVVAASV